MKVSIITPCYNSQEYIGRTLGSVASQTLVDWEQIVVDDGSDDGSAAIVADYARAEPRLRLVAQANGGVASARNRGFTCSSTQSEYLLFLDADDMLDATMLEITTGYLDRRPEVGMVYCGHTFVDAEDRPLDPCSIPWTPRYVPRGLGVGQLTPEHRETPFVAIFALAGLVPSEAVMRRSVYVQTPGWDSALGHIYEDTDLFLQMALRSQVHYLPQRLVRYRRHGSQSTADPDRVSQQERKLYAKWGRIAGLTAEQRAVVRAAQRFREGRLLPYTGVRAALDRFRRGQIGAGCVFLGGAIKRYARSFRPVPGVTDGADTRPTSVI